MRAQSSEQFDPSSAWRVAEKFLQLHGRSPDGEGLSAELIHVLMIGVWTGCRFGLLDRDMALAIAALGNAQGGLVFEALRRGFASEFAGPMGEVIHDVLYARGFTQAWAQLIEPAPEPLTGPGAIETAQEFLRQLPEGGDGQEGSAT